MLTQSQIDAIAEAVLQSLKADPSPENTKKMQTTEAEGLEDMTSPEVRGVPLLDHIEDREGLERMMARTTARIGVGNCGPRLKTRTMLTLRADHAAARDADYIIYNSTIDGELDNLSQLLEKSSLLADFKAVKEGNVWCTEKSLFQETMGLGDMILDIHRILTEEEPEGLRYMHRLR